MSGVRPRHALTRRCVSASSIWCRRLGSCACVGRASLALVNTVHQGRTLVPFQLNFSTYSASL
jgi:hypothetical protein